MKKIIEYLKATGDFLSFSRLNEQSITLPIQFKLNCHYYENEINVLISDTGIIQFEPQIRTSKDIILSSGIHGNETAPIEICDELIKDIFLGKLIVRQRIQFIFGNIKAMNENKRFIDENLNRLFSKDTPICINYEQNRAKIIEDCVDNFFKDNKADFNHGRNRYHYDLHTAIRGSIFEKFAIAPYLHGKPQSTSQLEFLNACDVNTVVFSKSATSTFSYYTANAFSAHAYTIELGKAKPFGENTPESFKAIKRNLEYLISDSNISLNKFNNNDFNLFEVFKTVYRNDDSFELYLDKNIENFSCLPIGTILSIESDKKTIVTLQHEAIIFPNPNVELTQRALLTVVPILLD
jgi:succinylglutamate desuccinylase